MIRSFSLRLAAFALVVAACGGAETARPSPKQPPGTAQPPANAAAADPLGPRPELGRPSTYTPPVPVAYKRENGLAVWLVERHGLPIVSMQLVVPAGASSDPEGKGGLAAMTANMLDEGAGTRGALDLARDIDRLGAVIETGAHADYAFAQLTVLKKNFGPAAAILGDVVAKPQMSAGEWKRIHDLWENALKARQSEPEAVADVVLTRKLYPPTHPYGHPTDGTLASAPKVTLDEVKKFYATNWRPDRAALVVVGDVTRADVDEMLGQAFAAWKVPSNPPPAVTPPRAMDGTAPPGRRVVIVDRPDAPQSVIAIARSGVAASNEVAALLVRVNSALGGSFTSRINQDIREAHGWSYGARTRFSFSKLPGAFVAEAAVHTEHTGEALKAMIGDVEGMAKGGLTAEEVEKTKQLARADLVEAFETVHAAATRLGRTAGIGLMPDFEASAAKRTQAADKASLDKAAAQYVDLGTSLVVIVGPRAKLEPQLKAIGITTLEASGPEGQ